MADLAAAKNLATQLKHSSGFTSGDAGSFSVPIVKGSIELPGKYNPGAYLDSVNLTKLGTVGVFYAGNGGLCVEALRRGADAVYAVEPRLQNAKAIKEVAAITQLATDKTFCVETNWSSIHKKFDTILWSEGLDQVGTPIAAIMLLYLSLNDGGKLYIEVAHGEHKVPEDVTKITAWRPQERVFVEVLGKTCVDAPLRAMKGRLDRRIIYEITRPSNTKAEDKAVEPPQDVQAEGKTEVGASEVLTEVSDKIKKINLRRKKAK